MLFLIPKKMKIEETVFYLRIDIIFLPKLTKNFRNNDVSYVNNKVAER